MPGVAVNSRQVVQPSRFRRIVAYQAVWREVVPAVPVISRERTSAQEIVGEGGSIRIDPYHSWSDLAEIIPAWENILSENPALSIFSTPQWLRSWWEAFGSRRRLIVLAFSDANGKLVGLAPLYEEASRHPLLGQPKQLRLVGDGSGDSDNLDLIVRPGSESICASALLHWVAEKSDCGVCSLNTLPASSPSARALAGKLNEMNWVLRKTTSSNSAILLPDSWGPYVEGLPSKFRRFLGQCRRRLASRYEIRFRRCRSSDELAEMLETLFSLHQKRWNSVGEPGSFGSQERRFFYQEMTKAFLERGWLELWTLELDGKPAAAQLGFRYRETVYSLQEGFDPEFAVDHVGHALRAAMLEDFVRAGVKRYDFLGGFTPAKERWGAECGAYLNLAFAAPRSIGGCYLACDKGAAAGKEWLREHLPPQAWQILHRVKALLTHQGRHLSAPASADEAVLRE